MNLTETSIYVMVDDDDDLSNGFAMHSTLQDPASKLTNSS